MRKNNTPRTPIIIAACLPAGLLLLFAAVGALPSPALQDIWATAFRAVGFLVLCLLLLRLILSVAGALGRLSFERETHRLTAAYWKALERKAGALEPDTGKPAWGGFRKFQVIKKVTEAAHVFSFYLSPHDRKPIPAFLPGQYLTFQLAVPDSPRPLVRCYSLSDGPGRDYFRITVKKLPPPPDTPDALPGAASCFLGDRVGEGDILDVKAPAGQFHLDVDRTTPVVMVGGGVGATPLISMLNAAVASGSSREIHFFYGVRNSSEHILKSHLETLGMRHPDLHLHICYSRPLETDVKGRDFHVRGRVSVDLMKSLLPASNYRFYVCGPPAMMRSITQDLREWGVPEPHIRFESFGPATVKQIPARDGDAAPVDIHFRRSGKRAAWTPESGTLLDLAVENGIFIESGCRTGNCGTCLTAVRSGTFEYLNPPGAAPEEGSCLTCIATPKTEMELDA